MKETKLKLREKELWTKKKITLHPVSIWKEIGSNYKIIYNFINLTVSGKKGGRTLNIECLSTQEKILSLTEAVECFVEK